MIFSAISPVTRLLGRIYYQDEGAARPGILPRNVALAVNAVIFCGAFTGHIFFGWLGDKLGRKKAYGITLILMVVFSLASGFSFWRRTSQGVMETLCFFRFWLGFGVGGVYPLSATIMSEYANRRTRGRYIAAVFAMQGVGHLMAGIVALILSGAFDQAFKAPAYNDDPIHSTVRQADYVWRIIFMFGAFPAAFTFFWLMKVPETARYTILVAGDAKQAAADMSKLLHSNIEAEEEKVTKLSDNPKFSFGLFSKEFLKCHGLHLLVTSSTWFLLDIAFYSQNLFQQDILPLTGWIPSARRMNALKEVNEIAKAQIFIALFAEIFPTRLRSTCHGISAAAGKAGVIVGAFGFFYAAQPSGIGVRHSLIILAFINLLGMLVTCIFSYPKKIHFGLPEPKRKSLEDLTGEKEEFGETEQPVSST
ncbi:hypothetical protein REPUB_Repub15cG0044700 [Reevesia pubescens]